MRRGSIRPAYPRLFVARRRSATSRTSSVSAPVAIGGSEETEEQLADIWESFNLYDVEDPIVQTLDKGFGFTGSWVVANERKEIIDDDFESYTAENPVTSTLNGGSGWDAAFVIVNQV